LVLFLTYLTQKVQVLPLSPNLPTDIPASPPGENRWVKQYEHAPSLKASNKPNVDVRRLQRRNKNERLTPRFSLSL
jgi:hypothetical protein